MKFSKLHNIICESNYDEEHIKKVLSELFNNAMEAARKKTGKSREYIPDWIFIYQPVVVNTYKHLLMNRFNISPEFAAEIHKTVYGDDRQPFDESGIIQKIIKHLKRRDTLSHTTPETADTFNDLLESMDKVPTVDEIYSILEWLYIKATRQTTDKLGRCYHAKNETVWWAEARKNFKNEIMKHYDIDDQCIDEIANDFLNAVPPTTQRELFQPLIDILRRRFILQKTAPETQDTFKDLMESYTQRSITQDINDLKDEAIIHTRSFFKKIARGELTRSFELSKEFTNKLDNIHAMLVGRKYKITMDFAEKLVHAYYYGDKEPFNELINILTARDTLKNTHPDTQDTFKDLVGI